MTRLVRHDTDTPTLDGPTANRRLTAWAGTALLALLAVEGVTIVALRFLVVPHIVVGLLLTGPLVVKLASTGYRFVRFSTGDREYVRAGRPWLVLRLLAPVLIVATLFVLITGTALLFVPATVRDAVAALHRAGFVAWLALIAVHVLAYAWRMPRLLGADLSADTPPALRRGRTSRLAAVAASLAVGALIAAAFLPRAEPWVELVRQRYAR